VDKLFPQANLKMSMKQDRYEVRAARVQDIPDLVAMRLKLEAHVLKRNPVSWEMSAKKIAGMGNYYRREIEDLSARVIVIQDREGGEIVGMGGGKKRVHDDYVPDASGRIGDVWIEPEHRRQGLGSRMVSELIRFFESEGIRALTLDYARGNREAAAFWLGLGFEPVAVLANADLKDVKSRLSQGSPASDDAGH